MDLRAERIVQMKMIDLRRLRDNTSGERNEGVLDPHHPHQNQGTVIGESVIPKVVEMVVKKKDDDPDPDPDLDLDHALCRPTAAVATHEIVEIVNDPAKNTKRRANPSIDPKAANEVKRKTVIIANAVATKIRKRRANTINHHPKMNENTNQTINRMMIIPLRQVVGRMVQMSNGVSSPVERLRCILIRLQMIWYGRRLGRIC